MNDSPSILDGFVGVTDAARRLGVCRMTVWRWVKAGKVPVRRIGRTALIEKKVVEEMKARHWGST